MKRVFYILSIVLLFAVRAIGAVVDLEDKVGDGLVLTESDTSMPIDTSLAHTHGMTGFTDFVPASYQVQKRWRPLEGDTAFYAKRWRNFVMGLSTGLDVMSNWHGRNHQIPLQAFLGYRITPIHQLRLQAGYEEMEVEGESSRRTSVMGELQWLASLSNFASGYNPDRAVEVSTLLGVGGRYYKNGLPSRLVPYARAGFDVSFRLGPNVSLFVQPYVGVTRHQDGAFLSTDPSKFSFLYGAHAGIAANFHDSREYFAQYAPIYRSFFFEASTGWGFNVKDINVHQGGNNDWVGIGRWVGPFFGFRVGGMGQQNYWAREEYSATSPSLTLYKHHASLSGRAEMLLNLSNLSARHRHLQDDPTWEFDLSAGVQYGYSAKTDGHASGGNWRSFNYGFTTALQALYKVSPGSYIFLEPRFFNYIYQTPYSDAGGQSSDVDRFVTLNLGTRVYVAPRSVRRENDNLFSRHLWVGLGVGGMKMFEASRLKADGYGSLQPTASLNLGYDAHPLATVRLQGEWQQLSRNEGNRNTRYQLLDLRAMYMLPFTNLVRGVDSGTRFHTYLELGPTMSFYLGQQSQSLSTSEPVMVKPYRVGRRSLGGMAGVFVSYDVTSRWDLYAEAQGQYDKTPGFTPGSRDHLNNLKWGLYGGVRYHFHPYDETERQRWATDLPAWMQGWFIEGSTGWTGPLRGSSRDGRQEGSWVHRSGALFNVNFGHWITPYLGARIGIQAQQHSGSTEAFESKGISLTSYNASATASGTLELLTNPLNYSKRMRQQDDRWFDLNLSVGFQGGYIAMGDGASGDMGRLKKRVVGFVSTLQPLFRVSPGVWLYAEPRFSTLHYDASGIASAVYPRGIMRNMAVSVGARIVRPNYGASRHEGVPDEASGELVAQHPAAVNLTFFPHWWVGVEAGGARDLVNRKMVGEGYGSVFQPTASFNAGYDFHPLVTLRGQFEYARLGNFEYSTLSTRHNDMYNLRLIYMLNMTNLWRGTRIWPRFSAYPEVGVAYSHHSGRQKAYDGHKHNDAFGLTLGAMVAWRASNQWDVTVETQEQYHWPHGFMPAQTYPKLGNAMWNLTAGVRYHIAPGSFGQIQWKSYTPQWQRGWFMEGGYGLNAPLGTDSKTRHLVGNSWQASFGHWFSSLLGFRAGVMGSQTSWSSQEVSGQHSSTSYLRLANWQFGGRVEALVNPMNFSLSRRHASEEPRFDLNLSAGFDFGVQVKNHTPGKHAQHLRYVGFTAAVQPLYRVASGVQVFVEPRFHTASYKMPNPLMLTSSRSLDRFFDLSMGARITRPDAEGRARLREESASSTASAGASMSSNDEYLFGAGLRSFWIAADLTHMSLLHCNTGQLTKRGLQPGAGISVGYDLHPLVTFRLQAKYDYLRINQPDYFVREDVYNLRAMYMLNLTNLWQGTRHQPRLSAYWEAGPTFSHYRHHSSMGVMTGINVALRVASRWDVTFESMGQYNFKLPYLPVIDRVRPSNVMMEFGFGTRMHF